MRADHPRMLTASPAMRAAADAAAQKLGIKVPPTANPPARPESPAPAPAANSPVNITAASPPAANAAHMPEPEPTAAASHRNVRNALIMRLRRLAPHLFASRHHPPLAIGIREEILAVLSDVDPKLLKDVLRAHTRSPGYLAHLAAGEPRRHLDGSEAGPPAPNEMTSAASALKARLTPRPALIAPRGARVGGVAAGFP